MIKALNSWSGEGEWFQWIEWDGFEKYLKYIRFGNVLHMWGKSKDDERDRKDISLVSSLCSLISDDAVPDVEHWKFARFGVEGWK